MPPLYGVGAAAGTSIALDGAVQARLATGDWPGAATQASYHLPLLGNARSSLAAWQQGDRSEAAFYAALFGLETLGLKGAGRRPVGPRVADGAKGGNPYIGKPKPELLKSKSSYEKLIKEHQAKLDAFKKDPIGNTNPANLKQMMKDNPTQEVLLERAKGRIGALEKQLTKQQGELKQINEALKKLE